jgi:hypothetical protein
MSGFKSWLYEKIVVCFVLKGAENLPARGRKTEKNITLALLVYPWFKAFEGPNERNISKLMKYPRVCRIVMKALQNKTNRYLRLRFGCDSSV